MGADTGPCGEAGRTSVPRSPDRRARFALAVSVLVVVLVGGGCEWWEWSSDSAVVAEADAPPALAQPVVARGGSVRPSVVDLAPTTSPPASTAPTTVPVPPPSTVPAEPVPATSVPPVSSPPAPPPEPEPVPVPAAPSWPAGSAQARALEGLRDAGTHEAAARALTLIRYDWPNGLPGWQLRFLPGRAGYRGLTYPDQRVIEVFIRPSDSAESIAHVTTHEIAHAIDVDRFGPADRSAWSAARGQRPGTPWFVRSGLSDFASGAGDFAESFAWWQTSGSQWSGHLGPPPSPTQTGLMALLTGGS